MDHGEVLGSRTAVRVMKFLCFFNIHCFHGGKITAPFSQPDFESQFPSHKSEDDDANVTPLAFASKY